MANLVFYFQFSLFLLLSSRLGADFKLRGCGVGGAVLNVGAVRLFVRRRRLARPVQMHRRHGHEHWMWAFGQPAVLQANRKKL